MTFLEAAWHNVLPILLVTASAAVLIGVIRERTPSQPLLRGPQWFFVGLWLMWVGDAVLGSNRPIAERSAKGAAAALLAAAVVIDVWRRRRRRRSEGPAER